MSESNGAGAVFGPVRNLERIGTGEQVINEPLIRVTGNAPKHDGVLILDEHLKILPRLQMHLLPHRTGQDDLAFFGENSGHSWKILLGKLDSARIISRLLIQRE